MLVEQHNEKFYRVTFKYNKNAVAQIKKIPGKIWNKNDSCWYVPVEQKEALEKLAGKWNKATVANTPAIVGPIPPMHDLPYPLPLNRPAFPFQNQGIAYCFEHGNTMIADEMGLGKTQQAIGITVLNDLQYHNAYPALVICPSISKINWEREWMMVAGKKALILSDRILNTWPQFYHAGMADIFIVNFESLKKYFVLALNKPAKGKFKTKHIEFRQNIHLFNTVIVDESHRVKEPDTIQTKITEGIALRKPHVYTISGTPIVNKTEDLLSQLTILGRLQDFGGEKYFKDRYCANNDYLEELNYLLNRTCFYSRRKKDVLPELPDKIHQNIVCDITNRHEYNEAENNLKKYLEEWLNKTNEEVERSLRGEIMVQMGICRKISARGKLQEAYNIIDDVVASGNKIVVFLHHKEIALKLKERYPDALGISGGMDNNARQANIDAFQDNPKYKIILVSLQAGGVALTLTAASWELFIERPWHAALEDQCIDRCHRIGQKDTVNALKLIGKNTVDEDMDLIIAEKRNLSNTIMGNEEQEESEIIDRMAQSLFKKNAVVEAE